MEDRLTVGEEFSARRLEEKNIKDYDRSAVRKDDSELKSSRDERR